MMLRVCLVVFATGSSLVSGWTIVAPSLGQSHKLQLSDARGVRFYMASDRQVMNDDFEVHQSRRNWLVTSCASTSAALVALTQNVETAQALVKGSAPPPKKAVGDRPKCTNVEECQALAEQREQQLRQEAEENATPTSVTTKGTR